MGKNTCIITMEAIRNNPELRFHVEPHLDEVAINPDGFFCRTLVTAGIWDFVTAKPFKILSLAVAEFLLNLEEGKFVTFIVTLKLALGFQCS